MPSDMLIKPRQIPPLDEIKIHKKRLIISITSCFNGLVALCNDNTLWLLQNTLREDGSYYYFWEELDSIPQQSFKKDE